MDSFVSFLRLAHCQISLDHTPRQTETPCVKAPWKDAGFTAH